MRNLQFLKDEAHGMKRRSTWLYPDDGCFARAALMVRNLAKQKITPPGKVFIFGDLEVKTKNSPSGKVSWWYHVVPVMKVNGKVVVFDPAIHPKNPLLLKDWVAKMTDKPQSVKLSLCSPRTYVPSSTCQGKTNDDEAAKSDQEGYLDAEWSRVQELGRDPKEELGENPPWLVRTI